MEETKDEVVTVVTERAAGCRAYYEEFDNRQLKCKDCLLFGVHCFGCSHPRNPLPTGKFHITIFIYRSSLYNLLIM